MRQSKSQPLAPDCLNMCNEAFKLQWSNNMDYKNCSTQDFISHQHASTHPTQELESQATWATRAAAKMITTNVHAIHPKERCERRMGTVLLVLHLKVFENFRRACLVAPTSNVSQNWGAPLNRVRLWAASHRYLQSKCLNLAPLSQS